MGVVVHYQVIILGGDAPPPADFGSGTMFDQIAARYDLINRVLAMRMDVGWRRAMTQIVATHLEETGMTQPRILDIATGTADVALQLAHDIPESLIVGIDPSQNMLEVGRDKIETLNLMKRIALITGDVRKLSRDQNEAFMKATQGELVDAVTMAFGIRNVPERHEALCEIWQVLKPGGSLAILEFSEPTGDSLLERAAAFFIRHVVPVVGGILSGAPKEYAHLQNSIQNFPSAADFQEFLSTLQCDGAGPSNAQVPAFVMEPVRHMNFGSVQLYVGRKAEAPANMKEWIEAQVKDHQVTLFTKRYCKFSKMVSVIFRHHQHVWDTRVHPINEYPDLGMDIHDTLKEMTGQTTVPYVFLNGNFIGGAEEAMALVDTGRMPTHMFGKPQPLVNRLKNKQPSTDDDNDNEEEAAENPVDTDDAEEVEKETVDDRTTTEETSPDATTTTTTTADAGVDTTRHVAE